MIVQHYDEKKGVYQLEDMAKQTTIECSEHSVYPFISASRSHSKENLLSMVAHDDNLGIVTNISAHTLVRNEKGNLTTGNLNFTVHFAGGESQILPYSAMRDNVLTLLYMLSKHDLAPIVKTLMRNKNMKKRILPNDYDKWLDQAKLERKLLKTTSTEAITEQLQNIKI